MTDQEAIALAKVLGWEATKGTTQDGDDDPVPSILVRVPATLAFDVDEGPDVAWIDYRRHERRANAQKKLVPPGDLVPYVVAGFREMKRAGQSALDDARRERERADETFERLARLHAFVQEERDARRNLDSALAEPVLTPLRDLDVSFTIPRDPGQEGRHD